MKAIQFTKEQIEARENGASKFIVPIDETIKEGYIFQGYSRGADEIIKANFWNESIRDIQFIELPIQKGDEFFIQEDFNVRIEHDRKTVVYGADLSSVGIYCADASQMQEHQSRHKDTCLGIEVKRVQDISHNKGEVYAIYPNAHQDGYDNFMHGFNDKFLDGKYEDNPYIFLITCKGIQQ